MHMPSSLLILSAHVQLARQWQYLRQLLTDFVQTTWTRTDNVSMMSFAAAHAPLASSLNSGGHFKLDCTATHAPTSTFLVRRMFEDVCEFNVNLMTIKLLWVRSSNKTHTRYQWVPPYPLTQAQSVVRQLIRQPSAISCTVSAEHHSNKCHLGYLIEESGTLLPQWFRIYLLPLMLSAGDMSNDAYKAICCNGGGGTTVSSPQSRYFNITLTTALKCSSPSPLHFQ